LIQDNGLCHKAGGKRIWLKEQEADVEG